MIYDITFRQTQTIMAVAETAPLLMRIVSSSVAVSYRAAKIARDVLSKGDLGIVEKVLPFLSDDHFMTSYLKVNQIYRRPGFS